MSVRERSTVCLILACDGCGNDYDGAADYTPHYGSAQDARDEAGDMGEWRTDGTQDWCEPCQIKPHPFVPDPTDPDPCARCAVYADEHEDGVA